MLCIGRNYHAHIAELNNTAPSEPLWFDKPMSSLRLSGSTLSFSSETHHEVELGLVIGKRGKDIKPENALKHIAGYFVGLDLTNRDLQGVNKKDGADWCLAKGADGYAAVSEYVHHSAVPDCSNVEVELKINGETK